MRTRGFIMNPKREALRRGYNRYKTSGRAMASSKRFAKIGKTKKSTENMVEAALRRQSRWLSDMKSRARRILGLNATRTAKPVNKPVKRSNTAGKSFWRRLRPFWFPLLCAVIVVVMIAWAMLRPSCDANAITTTTPTEEQVEDLREISEHVDISVKLPAFDIVRIAPDGHLVIAGRADPKSAVSIMLNKKIVATEKTNERGEFAYTAVKPIKPGNYTVRLVMAKSGVKSENYVFIYIPETGLDGAMSLLITKDGSKFMQKPASKDSELNVEKIDYLPNGRIYVQGTAIPRLRVSLTLDNKYLGFARVSDHKNFGFGVNTEELVAGREYKLAVRLHDASGGVAKRFTHKFEMPKMLGKNDVGYVVRRGDCLWIISRNHYGKGVMFTMIATANNIKNPDLIFPGKNLKIPF